MHLVDYLIVAAYLVGLFAIGLVLARKAGRGDDDYFLGGRNMPWWALGASGMSSNLDVAGTTTIIALIYHFGLHGFFIEFRGGVVLPIAVWLAFMGKWHRRSNVTTTAQWMELRFGTGPGGRGARFVAAMTYLVITVGMVFFFLSAAGSFIAEFWPGTPATGDIRALREDVKTLAGEADVFLSSDGLTAYRSVTSAASPEQVSAAEKMLAEQAALGPLVAERHEHEQWLAVGMAAVALAYTAAAGLYGVVWTDVFQAVIIAVAAVYTSVVAFKPRDARPARAVAGVGVQHRLSTAFQQRAGPEPHRGLRQLLVVRVVPDLLPRQGLAGGPGRQRGQRVHGPAVLRGPE